MSLSENILRLRTEKNLSQMDLADALEVSRQSVSKWETGAAVPELDKLIKLSKLFGVTLDKLVSGEAPEPKEEPIREEPPEPKVIFIEKPVFPPIKRQHIIGGVILFCALIHALILYNGRFGMEETLFMVLPVAACGVVFLLTTHPLVWCGWLMAGGYWGYFLILFHRWEEHPLLIILGVAVVATVAVRTLQLRRKGTLHIPFGIMLLGSIILILLFFLLCVNCVSFSLFTNEVSSIPPAPK